MSELALKCDKNACFKQIYTLKMFIAFKMAYSCCFSLGVNLHFPEFLQKCFIISTTCVITGPLVASVNGKTTLVGVTSFGEGCALPPFSGVYARVTAQKQWILDNSDAGLCQN